MFKSIFRKMFTMNILIILFIFLLMGVALFPVMGDYSVRQQTDLLLNYADRINDHAYLAAGGDMTFFNFMISSITENTQADVIVVNNGGRVVTASFVDKNKTAGMQLPEEIYGAVVSGETTRRIGKFNGLYRENVLTIGTPLRLGGSIIGGIFFNVPVPRLYKLRSEILHMMLWIIVFAFILEFVLIFIGTRRFSNNIRAVSRAARKLADGQFGLRVAVRGRDEISELATSFNQMAQSLEQLEDLRRSFIADASHELRTPVTTITGFVEGILDDTIPPDKQKEYLEIVLSEAKRLGRLTTSLLDVAKLDSAELKLEYSDFDINELLRLTLINLEVRINEKDLQVDVFFEQDPILVHADQDAIQRVLINLTENALKYTPQGGSIAIAVRLVKQKVQISVENSGEGIAAEDLAHIFDRFYKGDKSRGMDKSGVGLGLFIVKNLISMHEESIWAESEAGKYARFTFTLAKQSK